jgi:hypothetical protein
MSFFVSRWRDMPLPFSCFAERRSAALHAHLGMGDRRLGFVLVLGSIFYLVYRGLQNSRS